MKLLEMSATGRARRNPMEEGLSRFRPEPLPDSHFIDAHPGRLPGEKSSSLGQHFFSGVSWYRMRPIEGEANDKSRGIKYARS